MSYRPRYAGLLCYLSSILGASGPTRLLCGFLVKMTRGVPARRHRVLCHRSAICYFGDQKPFRSRDPQVYEGLFLMLFRNIAICSRKLLACSEVGIWTESRPEPSSGDGALRSLRSRLRSSRSPIQNHGVALVIFRSFSVSVPMLACC